MCDGHGSPLTALLTPGQAHECKSAAALVDGVKIGRRSRPARVAGDKGYSFPVVRRMLRRRGIEPVIPTKSHQRRDGRFDRAARTSDAT
jgi:transposase